MKHRYRQFLVSFSHGFIVLTFLLKFITTARGTGFREDLVNVVSQYDSFPPLDSDPTVLKIEQPTPIHVLTNLQVISIDDIEPGKSQFTARVLSRTYWRTDACNQTNTHEYACKTILAGNKGNHLLKPDNIKEPVHQDMTIRGKNMHRNAFDRMNMSEIVVDGEYIESIGKYNHQFDMKYYPWEIHGLELVYSSIYTSNIVEIETFQLNKDSKAQIPVPGGWTFIGSYCEASNHTAYGGYYWSTITCKYYVTRCSIGWFVTSFLLFICLVFASFAGSVGLISHIVAESRDDRDEARRGLFIGARMIGTFTIGLLLTYVLQVEVSPYEKPLDFWPNIPASSSVYCLGLISLFSQSFVSLIGSHFLKRSLGNDGFVGHPTLTYRIDECPKEGDNDEIMDPLIRKNNHYDKNGTLLTSSISKNHGSPASFLMDKTSARRRCNTKMYAVLSIEEAEHLNMIIRRMFITKVTMYGILQLLILSILINAYGGYNNTKIQGLKEMSKYSTNHNS